MSQNQAIEKVKQIKVRYEKALLKLANVVGVGIGFKEENNQWTEQIALVVNVTHKKALTDLAAEDVVPPEIEGIPTDVQEVGEIKVL